MNILKEGQKFAAECFTSQHSQKFLNEYYSKICSIIDKDAKGGEVTLDILKLVNEMFENAYKYGRATAVHPDIENIDQLASEVISFVGNRNK